MKGLLATIVIAGSVVLPTSSGSCGEWFTTPRGAAGIEQDGAALVVTCDTRRERALHPDSRGIILIVLREPRANWKQDSEVEVVTVSDGGSRIFAPSHGIAISSNELLLRNAATWELHEMGKAKNSFTITAGNYARVFSARNLRETTAPVLEKCGDAW
jgi:hypothetical protein